MQRDIDLTDAIKLAAIEEDLYDEEPEYDIEFQDVSKQGFDEDEGMYKAFQYELSMEYLRNTLQQFYDTGHYYLFNYAKHNKYSRNAKAFIKLADPILKDITKLLQLIHE